jgi:molybdopterin-guanine dinucleotide biosynthesis protein A
MAEPELIGAVIAGGLSTRYGSPKALARVNGVRIVDRVSAALQDAAERVVAIVNDPALGAEIALPQRADVLRDVGALAGVHAALLWARELGAAGIIAVGCDMPFVTTPLLRALKMRHLSAGADVTVPESESRRGVEPLCACYGEACIAAIENAVQRGDARMIGFFDDVRVTRMPIAEVATYGDPGVLFRNINTPADLAAAERTLPGER